MATKAPKQWQLTKEETINSFENWRQNLLYILSLDNNFATFLDPEFTWHKKTAAAPLRGFTDDGADVANRRTAVQKNTQLDLMLGQIANYCSVISRNTIIKSSTSLNSIWQSIREHYGFQATGGHFLDLASIKLEAGEKPEDLYQRILAFFDDNLLTADGGMVHHGVRVAEDEDLTPTLENTITYMWLHLVHPGLPLLVKQRYGAELRNRTLASLKSEISQALSSLLDELHTLEDTKAMRASASNFNRRFVSGTSKPTTFQKGKNTTRSCVLCKAAGRVHHTHFISGCRYLPEPDRQAIARTRYVGDCDDEVMDDDLYDDAEPDEVLPNPVSHRVSVVQSPVLNAYYKHHPVRLTIDTGATTNMVSANVARAIGLHITPATQMAHQADGVTPLDVVGETHCELTRDSHVFVLDALVVDKLDVEVLAGNPFLELNDVGTRSALRQITINGSEVIQYGSSRRKSAAVRRTQATVLSPACQSVILPGEFLQLSTPKDATPDIEWALEPRYDCPSNMSVKPEKAWPPAQLVTSVGHNIRLCNNTDDAVRINKHEHVCQIRSTVSASEERSGGQNAPPMSTGAVHPVSSADQVTVDPGNNLPEHIRDEFRRVNQQFNHVFSSKIPKYNGASGDIKGVVNMGPTLPPQRKGRLPSYNHEAMQELQNKFDELESAGIFAKPEDVGVNVEYLNMSFLVRKPNGGKRLVTSFAEVGQYAKPSPSLMPNVDAVLTDIGRWKYLIVTDLLKSFYQIPLAKASMKFCGVVTPYKGVRVYTRCAMGMPGSETCLEELMSRVMGGLIAEGCAAKIADDLYVGGDTPAELLANWVRVLEQMSDNNLGFNGAKTVIHPTSATILGWLWSAGTLSATPHKIAALSVVEPPTTVTGLRSFIGACKVLSRVLRGYSQFLEPLDRAIAGKVSKDKIVWSSELLHDFQMAQKALQDNKVITLPHPRDTLWIVTDASGKHGGLAATLYALRGEKLLLCGFFSAKLKDYQAKWLPCELEALAISAAVKHFSPYVVQSVQPVQVLTDSKPCVQAYSRLLRGEFSASARITTFLTAISRYGIQVRHIAGVSNLPSDYASRSPVECISQSCQVCKFVSETSESAVRGLSVKDVTEGSVRMPFTSRVAWFATQRECSDLRRTHSHLTQGTRPSKKVTKIPDVKRYLRQVKVAHDGVLVVRSDLPFQPSRERIVVPRSVVDGLLTAIHIRFNHPAQSQIKQVFNRYFFALDIEKATSTVTSSCHHCESLKSTPTHLYPQSTSEPPDVIGISFAADVMKRYRQLVLVLRESVSSYTLTDFIDSETHTCLRDAIITLCAQVRPLGENSAHIRVDPAPGLKALQNDPIFMQHGIRLEIGREKNVNKNPIAERAIQELGLECLHMSPSGGPLSKVTLALATANMNARIRQGGLSAREVWTQRDQITGEQLPIDDCQLILQKHLSRAYSHGPSSQSKNHGASVPPGVSCPSVGDLVYLKGDRDKTKAREKYMVVAVSDDYCQVRKFIKSQFRSKTYDVRVEDCYPIQATTLERFVPGPIRGLDNVLDNRPAMPLLPQQSDDRSIAPPPDPPGAIVDPPQPLFGGSPSRPPDPGVVETDVQQDEQNINDPMDSVQINSFDGAPKDSISVAPQESALPAPRRSTRSRKKPAWQDESWIME